MQRFIRHENIKRYQLILERTPEGVERQRIMNLLAEEVAKELDAGHLDEILAKAIAELGARR